MFLTEIFLYYRGGVVVFKSYLFKSVLLSIIGLGFVGGTVVSAKESAAGVKASEIKAGAKKEEKSKPKGNKEDKIDEKNEAKGSAESKEKSKTLKTKVKVKEEIKVVKSDSKENKTEGKSKANSSAESGEEPKKIKAESEPIKEVKAKGESSGGVVPAARVESGKANLEKSSDGGGSDLSKVSPLCSNSTPVRGAGKVAVEQVVSSELGLINTSDSEGANAEFKNSVEYVADKLATIECITSTGKNLVLMITATVFTGCYIYKILFVKTK